MLFLENFLPQSADTAGFRGPRISDRQMGTSPAGENFADFHKKDMLWICD